MILQLKEHKQQSPKTDKKQRDRRSSAVSAAFQVWHYYYYYYYLLTHKHKFANGQKIRKRCWDDDALAVLIVHCAAEQNFTQL